jgi:plasmid stability protein
VRTTLTLDDDIAARLKKIAHRLGISFKEAVNSILRRGLSAPERSGRTPKRFRVRTFRSPFQPGVDPLKLNQLSDEIEARRFRGGA